jgi:hypothetical protein
MEHTDSRPLTTVQQCVIDALAAGSTVTDAAEAHGIQRITIYRWMKTRPEFSDALHRARAEFVLARRDDLHYLSNRALETLLAVLDNPKASPAVLLRTAMFILQRPQLPKIGWCMPEPTPDPDGKKVLDSAVLEQDYDSLPGLHDVERKEEQETVADTRAETPAETKAPAESVASEPSPPADVTECYEMLHDSPTCDDVAPSPAPVPPQTGLRSCPVPAHVLKARNNHANLLEIRDMIKSVEDAIHPKTEEEDPETDEVLI